MGKGLGAWWEISWECSAQWCQSYRGSSWNRRAMAYLQTWRNTGGKGQSQASTQNTTQGSQVGSSEAQVSRAAQLSQHLSRQDSPLPSSPFSNPSPKSPNCYVGGRQTSSEKLIISKLYAMKSLFLPIPCTRFNDPGLDSVHSWCSWSLESQHWCKARSSARRSSGEWHLVEAHVGQTNDYCSDSVYS